MSEASSNPCEEISITKAEALRIQAKQIDHYVGYYGERVRALVAAATNAADLPEGKHPIRVINKFIPRGGQIEALIAGAELERVKPA